GNFVNPTGGRSLMNDRAINPAIQMHDNTGDNVKAIRSSLNILGDGFVESIDSNTLVGIANGQPAGMQGQFIQVPVGEANGTLRGGRFGWKNQHASLISFAADAYLNEMGITSPLQPTENNSFGASVAAFDTVPDPEDVADASNPQGKDVGAFARFMRS